jgi:hypothetical protein
MSEVAPRINTFSSIKVSTLIFLTTAKRNDPADHIFLESS